MVFLSYNLKGIKLFNWLKKITGGAQGGNQKPNAKAIATSKGEPWVEIVSIQVDPANLTAGAIELDWNDIFVARLVKLGYQGKTDQDIVDQWFSDVCRGIALEMWEQEEATTNSGSVRYTKEKNLGQGITEVS